MLLFSFLCQLFVKCRQYVVVMLASIPLVGVRGEVNTYPWPQSAAQSTHYAVRVQQGNQFYYPKALYSKPQLAKGPDGHGVTGLHKDRTMTFVPFAKTGDVIVEATKLFGSAALRVEISPRSFGIEPYFFNGRTVRFRLPSHIDPAYLSINFVTAESSDHDNVDNGQNSSVAIRHALMIFADRPEENTPSINQAGVVDYSKASRQQIEQAKIIYFPAGDHFLKDKFAQVNGEPGTDARIFLQKDGQQIYLAPGAIVRGSIDGNGHNNIKLYGRGLITGEDFHWHYFQDPSNSKGKTAFLDFTGCDDCYFDGFIVANPTHHTLPSGQRTHTKNIKIIGWASNQDGVRPSNDSLTESVFIKTSDDINYARNNNQHLINSVIWPMRNGALGMLGWHNLGSGGTKFKNLYLINSEWDIDASKKRNTGVLGAVLNQGVMQANNRVENLYGEWGMGMLTNISILYNDKKSPKEPSKQHGWGELANFTFKNIVLEAPFQNSAGVPVRNQLRGFRRTGAKAMIKNFTFINLVAGNEVIDNFNASKYFDIDKDTTENIQFIKQGMFYHTLVTTNEGGIVRPQGKVPTPQGMDRYINIIAKPGYCISQVIVDGKSRGRLQNVFFPNIDRDHTVKVIFAKGIDHFVNGKSCLDLTESQSQVFLGTEK